MSKHFTYHDKNQNELVPADVQSVTISPSGGELTEIPSEMFRNRNQPLNEKLLYTNVMTIIVISTSNDIVSFVSKSFQHRKNKMSRFIHLQCHCTEGTQTHQNTLRFPATIKYISKYVLRFFLFQL